MLCIHLLFVELYVNMEYQLFNRWTLSLLAVMNDIEEGLGQVYSNTKDLQQLQQNKGNFVVALNNGS